MKLIECVPNISEGRDPAVIQAVTAEIEGIEGVQLLDVDPGQATNRTVITFAGTPEPVLEAAFRVIRKAAELIDMSRHEGAHARMGATDVCPFVPMQGATMQDCVELAERLGKRVGDELGLPIFLYGEAARTPERRRLPDIRQGEYEALEQKLSDPGFAPDCGPATFNARAGATAIGAREFLIAWNVNLNTRNRKMANKIAAELREQGKLKRDANNKFVRDADGKALRTPGRFTELQGGGWYIDEYGRAQISFNLMNYRITSIQDVYDACCEEADKLGVRVTGSELVGLIPLEAILSAGDHYLRKEGATTGVSESERIHAATLSMGLAELAPFEPEKNIIELRYRGAPSGLQAMTVRDFADELASDSPAPGGGSVAALCGSLAAALAAMVAALTWNKKGMESARPEMGEIGVDGHALKAWFVDAIDADTDAFNAVLAAGRLPKRTEAQQAVRDRALEEANQGATRVPLRVLQKSVEAIVLCSRAAEKGNPNSVSDAAVGAACGLAAAEGAALNVRINLPTLHDQEVADEIRKEMGQAIKEARQRAAAVAAMVDADLD
ncbi:MAG: glutamate formimidoyltransferase [Acidobacteriota bacterium]|nr:glutamate formimidoyltransferase [Acidobacteriota bacterium]MDH3783783.1 glutamate formimidoyltransferase [Acidobacteriota bacterium]